MLETTEEFFGSFSFKEALRECKGLFPQGISIRGSFKNMAGVEAAFVSAILKAVGTQLAPLIISEFSSVQGVAKDLQELEDVVGGINLWLQTISDKELRNEPSSNNWLKKLKDAAYDAEDLVHEFHMEAEKHDRNVVGVKNVVTKYIWTKPKSVMFKIKTAQEIKVIRKRLDAIVKERSDYITITKSMAEDCPVPHIGKTIGEVPLWPNVDETLIFGRDQVKDQIISELIGINGQQKINTVSVVGLGGSGKTTLAKLVSNDINTIKKHFEVNLWVYVSREFAAEKLLEKLFDAVSESKPDHATLQYMSRRVSDKLAGKRFLVVLDDVWTEDRINWEQFMVHLKSGAPGSSILLTTRSRKVAEAVDSTYTFDLPFLSNEDSWKVFRQSFGMGVDGFDQEFLQVGNEIVNRCGGVPLAIKVLAGVLREMKRIEDWKSIRDNNLLAGNDREHTVTACLWLSYYYLPHHLKHCFTHCSIFPRGHEINMHHLISQWIVHGLVNQTNQVAQQDVGEDYFEYLLKVSFLQERKQYQSRSGAVVTTCTMHDLIHDLCKYILQDEFVSEIPTTGLKKRCRYLSLTACSGKVDNKLLDKVRALYVSGGNLVCDKKMNKQYCVRTVILDGIKTSLLSLFVSKFEHLGYLEIAWLKCEELPEAISRCWNLQAIHITRCSRLTAIPEFIGNLKKLRTLELESDWSVTSLPQSIGDCVSLQSLVIVGCGKLAEIPNSIGNIEKLRVLTIVGSRNLCELSSSEYFGKLCSLQTINLSFCLKLRHLPQSISLLSHLQHIDLADCKELVELPEGIGNLKELQVLNLHGCHNLCGLPADCGQLTRLWKLGLFVVGDSTEHARISELENLDKLNGELQIKNISFVKNPDDAIKARLKKKNGLRKLSLDWYSGGSVWNSDAEAEYSVGITTEEKLLCLNKDKDLDLLNSLEPPPEIEELRISGCHGLQLPHWMTKQSDSCSLADKHMLKQSNPPQFSHLTKLVLENLPNLEHLRGLVDLPGIKDLELRQMPKLVKLLTATTDLVNGEEEDEVQYCFPHLSTLIIAECPKLIVKPYFPPSLEKLTLEGSIDLLLSSGCLFHPCHAHIDESSSSSYSVDVILPRLRQLKLGHVIGSSSGWDVLQHLIGIYELKIHSCKGLRQLPESMRSLTCLSRLKIKKCDDLCVLPEWLGELQSLQRLTIKCLPALSNVPQSIGSLKSLQSLTIESCDALHQLPEQLGELCSLLHLQIRNLPALTCLPKSMHHLTSLGDLNLGGCGALTQLPEKLGELSALWIIFIWGCPGITSLPRSMKRLTSLKALYIVDCPELTRRCKEGVGEDWHLVSHVPRASFS